MRHWLEGALSDIRTGGTTTLVGSLLHAMGARGTETGAGDGPGGVGEFVGGPVIGPFVAAHGGAEMVAPSSTLKQHMRGANELVRGAAQMATPALALAAPEALSQVVPSMAIYGTAQQGFQKGAEELGADPDTAEFVGNLATLGIPAAKAGMPRAGRFVERNAGPIGKAAGYGLGAYETARSGNPQWLVTGSPRATALASGVARTGGRLVQRVGETPLLPHELIEAPAAPRLVDQMSGAGALPAGQYAGPPSPMQPAAQLGPAVLEGEYVDEPAPPPPSIRGRLRPGQYEAGPVTPRSLSRRLSVRTPEAAQPAPSLVDQMRDSTEPPHSEWPPEAPQVGSMRAAASNYQERFEDRSLAEDIREQAEAEDRMRLGEESRQRWAANDPSTPKSTLIEQMSGRVPERPIRYRKTPGVKYDRSGLPRLTEQMRVASEDTATQEPPLNLVDHMRTSSSESDEDLTPLLEESLRQARIRRGIPAP